MGSVTPLFGIISSSKSARFAVVVRRFFQALLAVTILGVVYRFYWIDVYDPFKCGALLHRGEWLDAGPEWSSENAFQNWQPPGCIMHEYKGKDIEECFRKRRLVFIGDSTIRQLFWAVAKKLDLRMAQKEISRLLKLEDNHKDLDFVACGVAVSFIWDPWLNSSGLYDELEKFTLETALLNQSGLKDESASLVFLGAPGLWYARYGQEHFFSDFKKSIDAIIPYMDHDSRDKSALPILRLIPSRIRSPNLLLLAPVQVPHYESLARSRRETIVPMKIQRMNNYLQHASAYSKSHVVWSYSLMTMGGKRVYEESGLHVVDNVVDRKADILLNLRCNADAAIMGGASSRTCCSNYRQPGSTQWLLIATAMMSIPALSSRPQKQFARISRYLPPVQILSAMATISLVICLCFFTDRTHLFEKGHKQFHKISFTTACLASIFVGLITVRRNGQTSIKSSTYSNYGGLLPRDQTDEWKGWMQFIILIYHYTHGSKILGIYKIVRLLVSSYLFMTGFGHTVYFLSQDDYSLTRVAEIMIRLNMLTCLLTYMMRTDYLFYYFPPLASFWILVIFFVLKIGHARNSNLYFLMGKIATSVVLTTALATIHGVLESVVLFLKYSSAISWNVTEWRFRFSLDMYIVYIGMLLGTFYHRTWRLKSGSLTSNNVIDSILNLTITCNHVFRNGLLLLSLILLPGFGVLIRKISNKEDYTWWQPYVSFMPILCFVVLRNCHPVLRNYHSFAFASFGRISLETYVLQYHIWMAGDTKGLLRLGIFNHWTETIILTAVFIWICWCTEDATRRLTRWIVHRNVCLPKYSNINGGAAHLKDLPHSSSTAGQNTETGVRKEEEMNSVVDGSGQMQWVWEAAIAVGEDLRFRLGLIVLFMWLSNWTYR